MQFSTYCVSSLHSRSKIDTFPHIKKCATWGHAQRIIIFHRVESHLENHCFRYFNWLLIIGCTKELAPECAALENECSVHTLMSIDVRHARNDLFDHCRRGQVSNPSKSHKCCSLAFNFMQVCDEPKDRASSHTGRSSGGSLSQGAFPRKKQYLAQRKTVEIYQKAKTEVRCWP